MKKITMLLVISGIISTGAMAQQKEIKAEEKVLKNTIKDKKEDRQEAVKDLGHLKVKSAIKGRKEVRRHRKSIKKQGKNLKQKGVEHPIKKAKEQLKEEKDLKNEKQ